jgi:hypothetical protein
MTIEQIKIEIKNGASFNGIVYGKDNCKNWTTLFIYLNGNFTKIQEVSKSDANAKKAEFANELKASLKTNVIGFGETYEKYGLDVAVGEAE